MEERTGFTTASYGRLGSQWVKENFFLQKHGTAMGPKNACSYGDLAKGEINLRF